MGTSTKNWTSEEDVYLLRNQSKPYKEIAAYLHRNAKGVECRLRTLRRKLDCDVSPYEWTAEQQHTMLEMRGKGATYPEICHVIGKTENAIANRIRLLEKNETKLQKKSGKNGGELHTIPTELTIESAMRYYCTEISSLSNSSPEDISEWFTSVSAAVTALYALKRLQNDRIHGVLPK